MTGPGGPVFFVRVCYNIPMKKLLVILTCMALAAGLFAGCAKQAEEGAPAAKPEAEPQEETVYFTADRPFFFVVTTPGGLVTFMGVVNEP